LRKENIGQHVTLCGWVDTYRDHSGVLFVDLRDRYGKTQIVFGPESGEANLQIARMLRAEYVISVTGRVAARPEGTVNPKLETGEIEIRAEEVKLLNKSLTPPLQPGMKDLPNEDIRLKHRYLDLRRPEMQQTAAAPPKALATTWCRAGCNRDRFTPCRNRRSSTSRS
jgi:aspartyl-tRNA synthetase